MNNYIDYFFYALSIFALLYWIFSTSSKKKFEDIKDVANTLRNVADDIDKAVDRVEKDEQLKNTNKENQGKKK